MCRTGHFLQPNFQYLTSCHINRALLHSPVIEGLTNLTKLSFHCGGGGGGWWYSSCWPILSSHRRMAKFSRLSGLKDCAAVSRKGIARAARLVHTHVFAKLAAAIARQKKTAAMQAVYLAVCFQNLQDFAIKSPLLLSFYFCIILCSLLSINTNEHCNVWPLRNYDCHAAFSFILQQAWIWDLEWRHLQIFTIEDKHSLGNAWNMEKSSPNPAHSLTCGRAYGWTMALVAAFINVIATDSCKPFALATTETKNTATSFWTISIQILLPGYAESVERVKKQQILRCSEVGKMSSFIWRPFLEVKLQRAYFRSKVLAPEIHAVTGSDILQNTPLCQHFTNTPALPGSIQASNARWFLIRTHRHWKY